MTRSNTNYRTAMVAPTPSDSIREAHSYEYDNNGNILYVNTSRVKPDMTTQPDTVQRTREERFRWDEENRLTALSQNGYVSHYWYAADGERDKAVPVSHYGARYYEPRLNLWISTDPYDEDFPNMSSYVYCNNNPIILSDPDGNSPTVIPGLIGGGIGAIIGGAIEAGTQLYKHGKINNWNAVGGAAAQGAITGAAAGLTCGANLVVTVGVSSASNVAGGFVNREIQGKETTATDVITDATIGGVAGSIGRASGQFVKKGLDASSAATKGKIGEATTQVKYALKGYKSNGKAVVETGKTTATGRAQVAKYDFEMENIFTNKTITVESKFNKSGFTPNQKAALPNVKTPFVIDRTTSTQFQKGVQSTVNFGVQQGTNRLNND